ncbi:hypothetical protein CAPTEDRAFT_193123 [Capitella teleta]|uniref:nitric-oxide synthase (NADPH) n=1 Tax=Capitella teleta TaxID=283909 RepID=R7UNF1_CAPTE|nr:hypothetical protein CAPTEDRAFT_193123 [Capitella teleta]|eukprot:ELU07755.1 hypothetical protein CAPTEDRAFT_193123 [Capitella teleta]
MAQPPPRPPQTPRPKEQLIKHAKDFIDQYYASIKRSDDASHSKRWSEVLQSITKTGTYEQTYAELTFGVKTAWRNAPKCIGRIQWSKIQVFDARDIRSARGMFDVLCAHIKFGSNKGLIRSAITVFPPRTDGQHDYRVWNVQLIRYAGYLNEDGSVVGDPASLDFTKFLQTKFNWKSDKTAFDVLPLVLQADGQDPEMFEIPKEIILEVELSHPE